MSNTGSTFNKLTSTISLCASFIGGVLSKLFGGFDTLLYVLVIIIIIDYITGVCKGVMTKKLSSATGFRGLIKKMLILCMVTLAVALQRIIGDTIPLREVVIMFYIANEGLSILENVGEFLPLPDKLKDILIQIREK